MLKLSHTQIQMLRDVRDGLPANWHCSGMAQHGGATGTRQSLIRQGLLVRRDGGPYTHAGLAITAAGRILLAEIEKGIR